MFYKFDKYFKISKIKIDYVELIENIKDKKVYKVNYKHGFNLWNPLTWMIIMLYAVLHTAIALKEVYEQFANTREYSNRVIKIKNQEERPWRRIARCG